ncbi:MAG: hypothetical protein JSR76_03170 [Verrucomicrobia bacterium]|nr:hypothetical protein [Verrucomicrobiota bacterium]
MDSTVSLCHRPLTALPLLVKENKIAFKAIVIIPLVVQVFSRFYQAVLAGKETRTTDISQYLALSRRMKSSSIVNIVSTVASLSLAWVGVSNSLQ